MITPEQKEELFKNLEAKGLRRVKEDLATGIYGKEDDPRSRAPLVKTWIHDKEAQEAAKGKQEELEISREANRNSKSANKLSIIALILAAIAVLISIFKP